MQGRRRGSLTDTSRRVGRGWLDSSPRPQHVPEARRRHYTYVGVPSSGRRGMIPGHHDHHARTRTYEYTCSRSSNSSRNPPSEAANDDDDDSSREFLDVRGWRLERKRGREEGTSLKTLRGVGRNEMFFVLLIFVFCPILSLVVVKPRSMPSTTYLLTTK